MGPADLTSYRKWNTGGMFDLDPNGRGWKKANTAAITTWNLFSNPRILDRRNTDGMALLRVVLSRVLYQNVFQDNKEVNK